MDKKQSSVEAVDSSHVLLEHAFRQFHAPLFFYALKFVDQQDVAKDLVQDAFLKLLNAANHSEIVNLKAYLFKMIRNNCLNYLKNVEIKNRFTEQEIERKSREIEYFDLHESFVEKESHKKLMVAIDNLPEKYRIPLKLSRFEELNNKEISTHLEIPVRTVETRIYRALLLLREKFKGQVLLLFSIILKKS